MKPISKKIAVSAAALSALALVAIAVPAARADEYCLTGPEAAHGCGFPSMDECRAASSGIGGTCSRDSLYKAPTNALAYQPKRPHSRSEPHPAKKPAAY